jgi:hypothetical protein
VRGSWAGQRVSVRCPYCGQLHWHSQGQDDKWQRMADCHCGEYLVVFTDPIEKET